MDGLSVPGSSPRISISSYLPPSFSPFPSLSPSSDAGSRSLSGLVGTSVSSPAAWLALLAGWVALCAALRHRRERDMRRRYGYPDRASLARMTNDHAQAILQELFQWEFPQLSHLSMQFALFKSYGFQSASTLLVKTRQLWEGELAPKRYEDTTVLFAEFMLNPPTSPRHLRAIARMNFLHRPYLQNGRIHADDLVYTLAVCIVQPVRFYTLYEWREPNEMEIAAVATLWKCVADGMGIDYRTALGKRRWRDGLEFYHDIRAWARHHEIEHMKPSVTNQTLGSALLEMMLFYVPGFAKGFAREVFYALMGDRTRDSFNFPEPGIVAIAAVYTALILRRLVLRYLCLPRMFPSRCLAEPHPQTGRTNHLTYLVRPYYQPANAWTRWGPAALLARLMGGTLPGDGGARYMPQGYLIEEIGPDNMKNRGGEEMRADEQFIASLGAGGRGGCPFARP